MSEPSAAPRPERLYAADPYEYGDARALMDSLELAEPIAITLVRRGHRTAEQARGFLEASVSHAPTAFAGIDRAVSAIRAAIEAGRLITVHGDYDVDGIAATAILVAALRRAGAECDWLIPDRAADGYGVSARTIERLAERGTGLLLTADCGIASPDEIAAARAAGIDAVVTDHHQPGPELPDCPIVHPELSGYPFASLCGAAVAYKLACALGDEPALVGRELDLVALATIADLVPLVDENRTLARRGIAELRRARRPGIRALLGVARVEPERLDEGDIAFRLAPRLNAAGRLYRADAAVELMLTAEQPRARAIAAELDAANHERRTIEREVAAAAAAAYRELGEAGEEAAGVVLAGEGWHPGVVGIAASRMVERLDRPCVLLSIDSEGRARGSGRSIPGFDLIAALNRCSEHLDRFGGHRAAAGVELAAERIEDFRAAFAAAAAAQLPDGVAPEPDRIDAVVGAEALDLEVAEQLDGLAPFGQGNPPVRFLVPWAQVDDIRPMGEEGRHARFRLSAGAASAGAVAFNANGALSVAKAGRSDLTVKLELNHWNGVVEPRAVLDRTRGGAQEADELCGCAPEADGAWWQRFEAALATPIAPTPTEPERREAGRQEIEHRRRSAVALIGELLSSGKRVLALSADSRRRARLASLAASPARFGGSHAIVCRGCAAEAGETAGSTALLLGDWDTLAEGGLSLEDFAHVVLVDPPPTAAHAALAASGGEGYLHACWAGCGELPERCWAERWQPRSALAEIYRGLLPEPPAGERLGTLLRGAARIRRDPEIVARCVRVLDELGLAEIGGDPGARELRVVSSERTELERSGSWRACTAVYEEGLQYLQSRTAT